MPDSREFTYEVALSFAGEDRAYVSEVAKALAENGVRVFYDEYETVTLWGKDLYEHLRDIYQNQARFTILFASRAYASKVWTNHERQSAQARAIAERKEYILPARFDDAEIPGLLPTTGYIDLSRTSPREFVDLILAKLGRRPGSWEVAATPALPDETAPREESLRERAARLAARQREKESREEFLNSHAGVDAARREVVRLIEHLEAEIAALREVDSRLDIRMQRGDNGVILVRSLKASFTMHWALAYGNTLSGSRLYTRTFNGPHSFESWAPNVGLVGDAYVHFDVDERLKPGWRHPDSPGILLSTAQLADKYLSRVVERAFSDAEPELEDDDEPEGPQFYSY